MKNTVTMNYEWWFVFSLGLILLLLIGTSYNASIASSPSSEETEKISLYYVTTRNQIFGYDTSSTEPGYDNETYRDFNELTEKCQNETVIFVHGWEESENNVKERLNRVKLSLQDNNHTGPLIGFSWPSDTVWFGANFIAAENGPRLAELISHIKNECPDTNIRLLAHSLGARVVLSGLDSLHTNQTWNNNNFTIKSVDLLGAAMDDEEVSNSSRDILIDQTNWGTPKSDYGHAIEREAINFTNYFSSKDNVLEPNFEKPYPPFQIYPSFEADRALGQNGYQKNPDIPIYDVKKSLPKNYVEKEVKDELVANCDADGDKKVDFPFAEGQLITTGDNHRGYLGYRNVTNNSTITDDGAINLIVENWKNEPSNASPTLESSTISSIICRNGQ
jgi:Alpha/beta hydrolase of unknown function (DUF900)